MQVYFYWIATSLAILGFGNYFDSWMNEKTKNYLSTVFKTKFLGNFDNWWKGTNSFFISVFDKIYISDSKNNLNRYIWRAVLLSYSIVIIGRLALWLFDIPVFSAEEMLTLIIMISIVAAITYRTIIVCVKKFIEGEKNKDDYKLSDTIDLDFIFNFILLSISFGVYTYMAISINNLSDLNIFRYILPSLASICIIASLLIMLIPKSIYKVNPFHSFLSSILFISLLSVITFMNNNTIFDYLIGEEYIMIFSFLVFNFFADLVSLQETRWILSLSRNLMGIIL